MLLGTCWTQEEEHQELWKNAKSAAYAFLQSSAGPMNNLGGDEDAGNWPSLKGLVKPGGDAAFGQLGAAAVVPRLAALGLGSNKKNRERALAVSLVVTALVGGYGKLEWLPDIYAEILEAARSAFPGVGGEESAEEECQAPEDTLLAIADGALDDVTSTVGGEDQVKPLPGVAAAATTTAEAAKDNKLVQLLVLVVLVVLVVLLLLVLVVLEILAVLLV